MGWTFTHREKDTPIRTFFEREFAGPGRVIDCAVVHRNTAYIAYELPDNRVAAIVCMLSYARDEYGNNFGYKDVDESMGPIDAKCPRRILEKLTPTNYEYANDWRRRCWARLGIDT